MVYCRNCQRTVKKERDYSLGGLVLLILFCWPGAIIYYFTRDKVCPICGGTNWSNPPRGNKTSNEQTEQVTNRGSETSTSREPNTKSKTGGESKNTQYCTNCGAEIKPNNDFCTECGAKA